MYYDERENNLNYSIVEDKNVDLTNNYLQNINEFNYDVDNKIKKFDNDFKVDTINVNVNNFRKSDSLYTAKEGLNKGTIFKKEYIPYKNYIYKVVVKGEKDELLLKIQELTFKMIDLNLYLDLNKDNTEIFNELKSTITELNKNKELYAKNYGPLCLKDNVKYNSYMWSKNPWPWMNTGGNYNV